MLSFASILVNILGCAFGTWIVLAVIVSIGEICGWIPTRATYRDWTLESLEEDAVEELMSREEKHLQAEAIRALYRASASFRSMISFKIEGLR